MNQSDETRRVCPVWGCNETANLIIGTLDDPRGQHVFCPEHGRAAMEYDDYGDFVAEFCT